MIKVGNYGWGGVSKLVNPEQNLTKFSQCPMAVAYGLLGGGRKMGPLFNSLN